MAWVRISYGVVPWCAVFASFFVPHIPKSTVAIAFANVLDLATVGRGMLRLSLPLQDNPILLGQPSPNRYTKNIKCTQKPFSLYSTLGLRRGWWYL